METQETTWKVRSTGVSLLRPTFSTLANRRSLTCPRSLDSGLLRPKFMLDLRVTLAARGWDWQNKRGECPLGAASRSLMICYLSNVTPNPPASLEIRKLTPWML